MLRCYALESRRFLSINPNRTFYERLGGHFLREQLYDWIGVTLPNAVLGWRTAASLIDSSQSAP